MSDVEDEFVFINFFPIIKHVERCCDLSLPLTVISNKTKHFFVSVFNDGNNL